MTRRSPTSWPSVTYFCRATFSPSTTQDEFARLLGADRGVGHQQRLIGRRAGHAHAPEHAGREQAVRIGEQRAAADRAGGAVDHVVDEVHAAVVREVVLVDQLQRDRDAAAAAGRSSLPPLARRS